MESRVYTERPAPPPASELERLAQLGTCRLADVMRGGLMSAAICPLHEPVTPVAGPAVTVSVTPGDFRMIPWAVDQLGAGDVLVADGAGSVDRAIWGDFVSARANAVGCAAAVIDGAARDVAGIRRLQLPVFARARSARGPTRCGRGEVNVPVSCGGVVVAPGDVVVADGDGIVAIPLRDVRPVLTRAEAKAASEPRSSRPGADATGDWREYLARMSRDSGAPTIVRRQCR